MPSIASKNRNSYQKAKHSRDVSSRKSSVTHSISQVTQLTSKSSKSKIDQRQKSQSHFIPSTDISFNSLLLESDLPPEIENQISNIMGWRAPKYEITSDEEDENVAKDEGTEKHVGFADEVKPKKKLRRLKSRRSVKPITEREGGISPKEQLRMGRSYSSFFQRIDNMDTSDEDELNIRLSDGLRTWLKFGMNITGNQDVIMNFIQYISKMRLSFYF